MKSHTSKIVETIVLDTFYVKWTARESCLAREEMWIHWLIDQGLKGLLDIPNRNSFDYYVEKETFLFCLEKLYKNMQANLEQHIKIYNKKKIKLLELGIQVKEITKKHDKKKILVAFKDFLEAFYIVHAYAFLKTDRIDPVKKALWYLRSFYEYLAGLSPQLTLQKTVHLSVAEI